MDVRSLSSLLRRTPSPRRLASRVLLRRAQRELALDKSTAGLAGLTGLIAGAVGAGELARVVRQRARAGAPDGLASATRATVAVAVEGYEGSPRGESTLFTMLAGFVVSFSCARLSTFGIRRGWWPFTDTTVGGHHVHHYVPGILLAFGAGGAAFATRNEELLTALALPFGAGVGLTFDEAALLLELEDVYWTREGLLSVQVSLVSIALLAGTILARRIVRRGEEAMEPEWEDQAELVGALA